MDMDTILQSVDASLGKDTNPDVTETNASDSAPAAAEETKASPEVTSTSVEESDTKAATPEATTDPKPAPESETAQPRERKVFHRSTSNDLSRAQYSAQKWQKKYKKLRQEYDAKLADFEKYKDLDTSKFEKDEDRQDYLAWKSSRRQNLQDLEDSMRSVAESYEDERREREAQVFDQKVYSIYGNNAERFQALEDQWGDTFEVACNTYDRGNVIRDFVKNSPLAPAIKNVIYGDGQLQHELFEVSSGNAMIDANNRLNILRNVEKFVYNYLTQPKKAAPAPAPVAQAAQAPAAQPKPRKLPHLPSRSKDVSSDNTASKPQVTGSLTKTDTTGNVVDNDAEIAKVYHSVFG